MGKVINIYEIQFAKKVCSDIPKIKQELDKMVGLCYPYMEYKEVGELHPAILEAKTVLDIQYKYYKRQLD